MNFLQTVRISGESMAPTLKSGQKALFIKSSPGRTFLGVGDKWLGKIVLISRINNQGARDFYQVKRITEIKDGKFYVTGDNSDFSTDSREFGWLSANEIVGKYLFKLNSNRKVN
jgi:signal peptidase I